MPKLTDKGRAKLAEAIGGLSRTSKMPCYSWSIPAQECRAGSALAKQSGTVCSGCYALKGFYTFKSARNAMARRWAVLLTALTDQTARQSFVATFAAVLADQTHFRWHDSGDLQTVSHLRLLAEVAEATPHCRHWLPTRESGILKAYAAQYGALPGNLTVRLSAHYVDGPAPQAPNTSRVVRSFDGLPANQVACQAPAQGGRCLDCRACWSKDVPVVAYHLH